MESEGPVVQGRWIKSRRSNPSGECVELAALPAGRIGVRHSQRASGPVIIYTRGEFTAFLAGAKDGEFDHLTTEGDGDEAASRLTDT